MPQLLWDPSASPETKVFRLNVCDEYFLPVVVTDELAPEALAGLLFHVSFDAVQFFVTLYAETF